MRGYNFSTKILFSELSHRGTLLDINAMKNIGFPLFPP